MKRFFIFLSIFITILAFLPEKSCNSDIKQDEFLTRRIFSASRNNFEFKNRFNFSSNEFILNHYPWQNYDSEKGLPKPTNFDVFSGSLLVECQNNSINKPKFAENPEIFDLYADMYAQAWEMDYGSTLTSFSFHISEQDKKETPIQVNISKDSWTGSGALILQYSSLISEDGWVSHSLDSPILLDPGKYYFSIKSTSGAQWKSISCANVGNNISETWWDDGSGWATCNYDICLKINVTQYISPEDIDLYVGSNQIFNFQSNYGKVDLDLSLNDYPNSLELTSNSSSEIYIQYMLDANYSRSRNIEYQVSSYASNFLWNLSLPELTSEFSIQSYKQIVYGLQKDYSNIELMDGNTSIAYEIVSPNLLVCILPSKNLIFQSTNYIAQLVVPSVVILGETIPISVNCYSIGDISIFLNYGNLSQLLYSFEDVQSGIYDWIIDPNEDGKNISIDVVYYGENQVGFLSLPLSLLIKGNIIAQNYLTPALETVEIICQYQDFYSQVPIFDAEVILKINEIQLEMDDIGDGWYSSDLDLDKYRFLPGNHSLKIMASKDGFSSLEYLGKFQIIKNKVNIEVILSNSKLKPGQILLYSVLLQENITQNLLRRPVSITVRIDSQNEMNATQTVYVEKFEAIISSLDLNWTTPTDLQENQYSITVEVISDYYQGKTIFSDIFETVKPLPWYLYLLSVTGAVSVGGFSFFFYREKVKQSVLGVITLHDNGMPLAHQFSEMIVQDDIILVSAAFTGILSIIKEITGSHTRVIEIDGGYLNISKEDGFWLILLSRMHPRFIESTITKFINSFKEKHITNEILEATMPIQVDFNQLLEQYFHTKFLSKVEKGEQNGEEISSLPENMGPSDTLGVSIPSDADLE